MLSLLKFEINRSKGMILLFTVVITLFGFMLLIIDHDHEKIVITISALQLFIPFLLIIVTDIVHINQDFWLDSKNLYLSIPKSSTEIIESKLGFAVMNYMLFFFMISLFNPINTFNEFAPFTAIAIFTLGILIELTVLLLTLYNKK